MSSDVPSYLQSFQKKPKHKHHKSKDKTPNPVDENSSFRFLRQEVTTTRDMDEDVQASYHLASIVNFLEKRAEDGHPEVSAEDIENACKLELKGKLVKRVRDHPFIQYESGRYSWRGNLESLITNRDELLEALKLSALKTSDLRGCYKGYEKDLKEFVEQQIIGMFSADSPKEKVYFYYDPDLMESRASSMFRDMWKAIRVPESNADREANLRKLGGTPVEIVQPLDLDDEDVIEGRKKTRRSRQKKWVNQEILNEMGE